MELLYEIAQTPTEGKLFEVRPLDIDRNRFKGPWYDHNLLRKFILKAFDQVDKYPKKYATPFYTLIPEKNWNDYKTVAELTVYANELGGRTADWVEQGLEWAQRLSNGESIYYLCITDDITSKWRRMICWSNGYYKLVGGYEREATWVNNNSLPLNYKLYKSVPLVRIEK